MQVSTLSFLTAINSALISRPVPPYCSIYYMLGFGTSPRTSGTSPEGPVNVLKNICNLFLISPALISPQGPLDPICL